MTTAIQVIRILGHEERPNPKLHVVYRIEVQASVRSWLTWRRYSEFEDLHSELTKATGAVPPHPLPPKHRFSLLQSKKSPKLLKERVESLEVYLRAILSSKNDTWRETYDFKEFLGVPIGRADARMFGPSAAASGSPSTSDASGSAAVAPGFTSSSWLDEHMELQSCIREIRADITKRDTLVERGDVSSAHMTSVQAKKRLAGVLDRLGALAGGLAQLDTAKVLSGGEIQRRTDMLARLQDECQKLGKMMLNARNYAAASRNVVIGKATVPESDREALMGSAYSSSTRDQSRPYARVFGAAALEQKQQQPEQETEETRPLDNTGVFHLQRAKIEEQDTHLSQLSTILRRQGQLALAIKQEVSEHMELLGALDQEVDSTGAKLAKAKKELRRIDNS